MNLLQGLKRKIGRGIEALYQMRQTQRNPIDVLKNQRRQIRGEMGFAGIRVEHRLGAAVTPPNWRRP